MMNKEGYDITEDEMLYIISGVYNEFLIPINTLNEQRNKIINYLREIKLVEVALSLENNLRKLDHEFILKIGIKNFDDYNFNNSLNRFMINDNNKKIINNLVFLQYVRESYQDYIVRVQNLLIMDCFQK